MVIWKIAALAGRLLVGAVILAPIVIADARPLGQESLRLLGNEAHWVCTVTYTPGGTWASVEFQMDNMGNRHRSE